MIEDITGWLFLLFMLCLIGFIIYLVVKPKNRFREAFDKWKSGKTVSAVGTFLRTAFLLVVFGLLAIGAGEEYVNESGWYPRTREVAVEARVSQWVTGEFKECRAAKNSAVDELTLLECAPDSEEPHTLNVKFWGPITTERIKTWKCQRQETSLTCWLL